MFFLLLISICCTNTIKRKTDTCIKSADSKIVGKKQKIPFVIFQTNKEDEISVRMKEQMQNIINLNPEYAYKYFNDDDCRKYLAENYGEEYLNLYNQLVPGAFKSDFFRACYLCKDGGIYLDTSFRQMLPFSELIDENDEFIAPIDGNDNIYNAFMCSIPNHPLLVENIELIKYNITNRVYGKGPVYPTGPGAMGDTYKKLYGKIKIGEHNGIKIIEHTNNFSRLFSSNYIKYKNKIFFATRYKNYKNEGKKGGSYIILWWTKKIYKDIKS